MVATSTLQGGPGLPILLPAAYKYICTGDYINVIMDNDDVPDPEIRKLLNQVRGTLIIRVTDF